MDDTSNLKPEHAPAVAAPKRMGRRTDYKPEFVQVVRELCASGATDEELAEHLGVNRSTIYRWKNTHPEFCHAIKVGKGPADQRVVNSLYKKAVGYEVETEKVFQFGGKIIKTTITEYIPPDTKAAMFWLKNRLPGEWRDKPEIPITDDDIPQEVMDAYNEVARIARERRAMETPKVIEDEPPKKQNEER